MSNVIDLFAKKEESASAVEDARPIELDDIDVTGLIRAITDWAEDNEVDTDDVAYQIRVADLVAHLQIMSKRNRGFISNYAS